MANLIIYYTRNGENYVNGKIRSIVKGNSEIVAELIRRQFGGDLFKIETVKEYPSDYMACCDEAKREKNEGARPELKNYLEDISAYDKVFIVGPCWWGTFPCAVFTQLERLDWSGKKVFVVMTHEGSGLGTSVEDVKKVCAGAEFVEGFAVHGAEAAASEWPLRAWVVSIVGE